MKILKDLIITEVNKNDYKKLKECGNITITKGVEVKFPVLTTSGNIDLRENARLIHPKTKNINYKSVDNTMFVTESEKISKSIKILSGYILRKFEKKSFVKEVCFVAEKDNYFAHGETVKKAISDLQFKIISEKLKKEPIKKDTIITIHYYRLITGACELGAKSWMKQNNIKKESYKASELLPLLEKTNAYGLSKFKSLITF